MPDPPLLRPPRAPGPRGSEFAQRVSPSVPMSATSRTPPPVGGTILIPLYPQRCTHPAVPTASAVPQLPPQLSACQKGTHFCKERKNCKFAGLTFH